MAVRAIFPLASLVLVAGALVFMFFVIFGGVYNHSPVNKFYLLEATTGNIPGAPTTSHWSYWNVCGTQNGLTVCDKTNAYSKIHPAFPLDPASHRNFDTTQNIPSDFVKHHAFYYYMTRFMFAFMLIALFFGAVALLTGLLALCTRLGSYLSGLMTMIAAFFQAVNAALMTAAYVKGRNAFRSNGQSSQIGKYAFGFEWAAFACFFISMILFCVGGAASRDKGASSGRRFGGRRNKSTRSTKSRGSFVHDKEYGS
ncbi:hypothetical protein PV11_08098 [Exophiala sideris]|uniref:Uncharacterized protein n=1 Tax=Exophiala sideris TaxID=1016849 RepID=A0A0D1YC98_9EURO|nr:hypothetical protein PV11_08098 [Exophiala sideris]